MFGKTRCVCLGIGGVRSSIAISLVRSISPSSLGQSLSSLAKVKRDFWRPFYFRSLPEAVDEVIDCMMHTYAGIHERADSADLEAIFRCIASVRSAARPVLHVTTYHFRFDPMTG